MRWIFTITEESACHFVAEAKRFSGETISAHGDERVIPRILHEAYQAELKIGTCHGDAAYHITASFLSRWPSVYHEKTFGCWTVGKDDCFPRIDYDGKDFYLMVSETTGAYSWQGNIDQLAKEQCGYFRKITELNKHHP